MTFTSVSDRRGSRRTSSLRKASWTWAMNAACSIGGFESDPRFPPSQFHAAKRGMVEQGERHERSPPHNVIVPVKPPRITVGGDGGVQRGRLLVAGRPKRRCCWVSSSDELRSLPQPRRQPYDSIVVVCPLTQRSVCRRAGARRSCHIWGSGTCRRAHIRQSLLPGVRPGPAASRSSAPYSRPLSSRARSSWRLRICFPSSLLAV